MPPKRRSSYKGKQQQQQQQQQQQTVAPPAEKDKEVSEPADDEEVEATPSKAVDETKAKNDKNEESNGTKKDVPLVLPSDKKRGIYECDYCHADISQVPRIRCAICPDFDLCLDCFATTDHTKAIARLKAMGEVHDAVSNGDTTTKAAVSSAAINHDETHGYRVADSTRYLLFPSTKSIAQPSSRPSSVAPIDDEEDNDEDTTNMMLPRTPHKEINQDKKKNKKTVVPDDKEVDDKDETTTTNDEDVDKDETGDDSMDVDTEESKKDEDYNTNTEKSETEKSETETADQEESEKMSNGTDNNDESKDTDGEKETETSAATDGDEGETANEAESKDASGVDLTSKKSQKATTCTTNPNAETNIGTDIVLVQEDSKSLWTVEEDLRLLDAIETCGLGNWADIAETVAGHNGSTSKSAKRCMERYLDDFLGKYGEILPPYTIIEDQNDSSNANANADETTNDEMEIDDTTKSDCGDAVRASKRRRVAERSLLRSHSMGSNGAIGRTLKNVKVVPTSSLPGYDEAWPSKYIPDLPGIEVGQEVGRDQKLRAENLFLKTAANCSTKAEVEALRQEWAETRLHQPNGPTVLPMRPEDIREIPGSELAGFMPRRGDFDMEWENDAENIIADMEFSPNDLPADRQLKLQVIEIYNQKLEEREKRKEFLLTRNLLDYRKNQKADAALPSDERDLIRRMRLIERYHTPEEHKQFISDLLKAKRLWKEIAKLQMYRRMGIRTLVEAERYELDKNRREHHKMAHNLKEAAKATAASGEGSTSTDPATTSSSLWKQYKTSNRKDRKSIKRQSESFGSGIDSNVDTDNNNDDRNDNSKDQDETNKGENKVEASNTGEKTTTEPEPEPEPEPAPSVSLSDDKGFNIEHSRGYELLTSKEIELCEKLQLLPSHYIEIKKTLIQESLKCGLLDKQKKRDGKEVKRTIFTIDAKKKGDVIDFMVSSGWISPYAGATSK